MTRITATHWTPAHGNVLLAVQLAPREIGRRIASARQAKGWTQFQFALEANVSPSTIARWEAGKLPPIRELMRVAELLEISPDSLVELEEAPVDELRQAVREELADVYDLLAKIENRLERAESQAREEPR